MSRTRSLNAASDHSLQGDRPDGDGNGFSAFTIGSVNFMQPPLTTPRLCLRPLTADDAPAIQTLAGDFAVADTTLTVPHPYPDGVAETWIATHVEQYQAGQPAVFAITLKDDGTFLGTIGLALQPPFQRAELGYWIGVPFWNRGFCTEAARAMVEYGFSVLGLHKICAHHFTRNPASGRVMQKIGMRKEGTLRDHVLRWNRFEDVDAYGLLATEANRE